MVWWCSELTRIDGPYSDAASEPSVRSTRWTIESGGWSWQAWGGDVLVQGAPAVNVQHLDSPADAEHGLCGLECSVEKAHLEGIAIRLARVQLGARRMAVALRLDVGSAAQQQPVEAVGVVGGIGVAGQEDRQAAGGDHPEGVVAVEHVEVQVPERLGLHVELAGGLGPTRDADERSACHGRECMFRPCPTRFVRPCSRGRSWMWMDRWPGARRVTGSQWCSCTASAARAPRGNPS